MEDADRLLQSSKMYKTTYFSPQFIASCASVFSILNTMVGSTIFSMPWAFRQSGLIPGIIIFCVVGCLSYYTCTLVIRHGGRETEFSNICRRVLGPWAQRLALTSSVIVLVGAAITYHCIMTPALVNIVKEAIILCGHTAPVTWWHEQIAAVIIAVLVFPLPMLKSLDPLIKFNSSGILFVFFLLTFVVVESFKALANPSAVAGADPSGQTYFTAWSPGFADLAGVLSLSFFIHNIILPIVNKGRLSSTAVSKTAKSSDATYGLINQDEEDDHHALSAIEQEQLEDEPKKKADLKNAAMAYMLAAVCYAGPALLANFGYSRVAAMPENFLGLFPATETFAFITRISVFLQLYTVYPLLVFIIRTQIFTYFSKAQSPYPSVPHVLALTTVLIAITTLFAAFYSHIGAILRLSGAFTGLVFLYFLPIAVHLKIEKDAGRLTKQSLWMHGAILIFGFVTVVMQFT